MGFFDSLFGNGGRGLTLEDMELGSFQSIAAKDEKVVWEGSVNFLGQDVSLVMSGDETNLNEAEKKSLDEIIKNEADIESQIDQGLAEAFDNADKEYSKWRDHFNFISISTNHGIEITFEEKESRYLFDVHFEDNKFGGLSING